MMSDQDKSQWIAVIATVTALVSCFLGPFVSYCVARRQITASVVSANRQSWINELRNDLAEFISCAAMYGADINVGDAKFADLTAKLAQLRWKLHLLINPNEDTHKSLIMMVDSLVESVRRLTDDLDQAACNAKQRVDRKKLIELAQVVLKEEWNRVKRGE